MNRRRVLRAGAGVLGTATLPGCGVLETRSQSVRAPPLVEDRPAAVYKPTHVEEMELIGTGSADGFTAGAMYSYPHRFWTVTGTDASKTSIGNDDAIHLMVSVWDAETGIVLPETGLDVVLRRDGDLVSEEVVYPMLSQRMGFHYGDNFGADGDGTYELDVQIGAIPETGVRTTGAFRDRFTDPATISLEFEYSEARRDELDYQTLDDAGDRDAVDPTSMGSIPNAVAPGAAELPGTTRGTATIGDVDFVVTVLDSPPAGVDGDGQYLAVSARTPYNRMIVPAMTLTATLTRDGRSVSDDSLTRTLDPAIGYHYGAAVDTVTAGDTLELTVEMPSQTARHEGYETAFLETGSGEVSL